MLLYKYVSKVAESKRFIINFAKNCNLTRKVMSKAIVDIDGSLLEGGGQILRMSLIISVLTRTPIHIFNIRAGRSKPGLMEQHLKGVLLVRDICDGKVKGAELGSTELTFYPGKLRSGRYIASIRTAGSISLLMQVAIPCLLFADGPSKLSLFGGTNAEMAPQVEYMTEVFRPNLEKFGATFEFLLLKRGYYPKGGGHVEISLKSVEKLTPVQLTDRGRVTGLWGWSFAAGVLPEAVAREMGDAAIRHLKPFCPDVTVESYKEDPKMADGNCSGIMMCAETSTGCRFGGSALGKRGEQACVSGVRAADELIKTIREGACVDDYSQDQIIILMALADGTSRVRAGPITMHTNTAIYVAEKLTTSRFKLTSDGGDAGSVLIECQGVGLRSADCC